MIAPMTTGNAKMILDILEQYHIPTMGDLTALKKVTAQTWILIDDAQRAYTDAYEDLWIFLIKDLRKNRNIKVIIATTHDMTTPAAIGSLPHVFDNFNEVEVLQLIQGFCSHYACEDGLLGMCFGPW
jgi:hypothetical protein